MTSRRAPQAERTCRACSGSLRPNTSLRVHYCSPACREAGRKVAQARYVAENLGCEAKSERQCKECSTTFTPALKGNQRYCSVKCRKRAGYVRRDGAYMERARRNRGNNPRWCILNSARGRARDGGYAFDLTLDDIVIPEVCPVLGIPLEMPGRQARRDNVASLDKIVPSRGYVKGNIEIISFRANRLKSDASLYEMRQILTYMEKHQ